MQLFDILTAFNNWRTFGRPDPSAANRPWWNRYPTTNGQLPTSAAEPAAAKTDTYVPGNQVAPEAAAPVNLPARVGPRLARHRKAIWL